jgi:ATP-dependent Clp protease ATP-binding subunit ClpA
MQLEAQLAEKKVEVQFTEALKKYLSKNGFDPLMGARPMARLIQDTIRRALADELLFGKLAGGGRVTIDADAEGKVKLDIATNSAQPAEPVEST